MADELERGSGNAHRLWPVQIFRLPNYEGIARKNLHKIRKMMYRLIWSVLFLLWSNMLFSQQLTAIVTDEKGQPLPGANIRESAVHSYAVSDKEGHFSIKVRANSKGVLEVSYIGFNTALISYQMSADSVLDLGKIKMEAYIYNQEEVVVVATRDRQNLMEVPADIALVDSRKISMIPSDKIDQNLKFLPGIYVDRPFGIFGKSVVGLRSVVSSEPGRQLTLIDGVPINKSDGGGSNWNRIIESDYSRIEVLKGPGAAVYGNNAMGGVINLVQKMPDGRKARLAVRADYAAYNTWSGDFSLMQNVGEKQRFYYALSGKGLKSDGYMTVPDSIRDYTDTTVFLKEYGFNCRMGYRLSGNSWLKAEYNYYDEYRGQGTKIRLEDGAVAKYKTHFGRLAYNTGGMNWQLKAIAFYQLEDYGRDIEKLKKANYTQISVNSDREDYGLMLMLHYRAGKHKLSFGSDFRLGSVYGVDDYQSSTDKVINKGRLNVLNFSVTDEWRITDHWKSIIGLHYAFGHFYDGAFLLEDATPATSFMQQYAGDLSQKYWSGFSPRIAVQYDFSGSANVYILYSHGYRAPSLDDLTRYGFINIGYKKANPALLPENLDNVEAGYRIKQKKWGAQVNTNMAKGRNFMYYVATGESLFGGRKKVYKKENVGTVSLYGLELSLDYIPLPRWHFNINYTLNGSRIDDFAERPDLEGKRLSYVPADMANLSASFLRKSIRLSLNLHYQGVMYLDEQNTFEVNPLFSLDATISWYFYRNFALNLSGQNLFDEQHMVSSDQVSLGRYLKVGLQYGL
jgi:iron complex outermembrane receptor protein